MHHIHVVNQVIEKSAEYPKPLHMAFVDYEKAFDSVLAAPMLEALKDKGIEDTYRTFLEDIYKECAGRITLHK